MVLIRSYLKVHKFSKGYPYRGKKLKIARYFKISNPTKRHSGEKIVNAKFVKLTFKVWDIQINGKKIIYIDFYNVHFLDFEHSGDKLPLEASSLGLELTLNEEKIIK